MATIIEQPNNSIKTLDEQVPHVDTIPYRRSLSLKKEAYKSEGHNKLDIKKSDRLVDIYE